MSVVCAPTARRTRWRGSSRRSGRGSKSWASRWAGCAGSCSAAAAPLGLAAIGRPGEGGGCGLRAAGRRAGEGDARAAGAWLRERLAALREETQVQLLGLAGLVRAVEVAAEGDEVRLRIALSR